MLKNGNNCGTSVDLIKFTVCNRSLVAVLVRHWAAMTQVLINRQGFSEMMPLLFTSSLASSMAMLVQSASCLLAGILNLLHILYINFSCSLFSHKCIYNSNSNPNPNSKL